MKHLTTIAASVAASSLAPAVAFAQGLPDLSDSVTQSGQIGRAVDASIEASRREQGGQGSEIDGEAGVYVLNVNEIFRLSASGSLGYTDTPTRNADPQSGDGFGELSVTAGMSTRLGEKVDFGLSANVGGREFFSTPDASSRNLSGTVSAGVPVIGPVYLNMVGFGGWNYDKDFQGGVSFHGMGANLSAAFPLGKKLVLRPGVGVNRQWSEVSENNSTTLSAGLDAFYQLAREVSMSARAGVSRRWFDNFYEDVTFVERKDWNWTLSASVAWRPAKGVVVGLSGGYEKQASTFFLSAYDAFEGAVQVGVTIQF